MHSNIAFPLLRKLVEAGDEKAKKVFKEEICKKLEGGSETVINYLMEQGYTKYLTHDELIFSLLDTNEYLTFTKMEQKLGKQIGLAQNEGDFGVMIRNGHVIYLLLRDIFLTTIPKEITLFLCLEYLDLRFNNISKVPNYIKDLKNLKILKLNNNQIEIIPEEIGELSMLEKLEIVNNLIGEIPRSIGKLKKLTHLNIARNLLRDLPQSIGGLDSLKSLNINSNKLNSLTDSITELKNLRELYASYNHLETIQGLKGLEK